MKVLDIYITEVCNLHCDYCYVDLKKKDDSPFSSGELLRRENLLEYDQIKFLGGEPLIKYEEIKKLITAVHNKNKNIHFSIITNGLLINHEKLKFLRAHNTSFTLSLHKSAIARILKKEFLQMLLKYKEIIGFVLLYDYNDIKFATKLFLFLEKIGFLNFSINPLADINWDDDKILLLKKELAIILKRVEENTGINISESNNKSIKNLDDESFCKKEQIDVNGKKRDCTRFHKEEFVKSKKNIFYVHDLFDEVNSCKSCKNKWFCTCPIGWYLDNEGKINETKLAQVFHNLNETFINFYRNITKIRGHDNFLSNNIGEIRFNITEQCNLRCEYCYVDFRDKYLDVSIGRNIVEYFMMQDGDEKIFSFLGGEPLLGWNVIVELIEYVIELSGKYRKSVKFKMATNAILLDKEKILFLKKYKVELHISFNGTLSENNRSRDGSSELCIKKLQLLTKYGYNTNDIVILYVLFPHSIMSAPEGIKFLLSLGFSIVNFEVYLGDKYEWDSSAYSDLEKIIKLFSSQEDFSILQFYNFSKKAVKFLDISSDGKIHDNSLEFYNSKIDFTPKKHLDRILSANIL